MSVHLEGVGKCCVFMKQTFDIEVFFVIINRSVCLIINGRRNEDMKNHINILCVVAILASSS